MRANELSFLTDPPFPAGHLSCTSHLPWHFKYQGVPRVQVKARDQEGFYSPSFLAALAALAALVAAFFASFSARSFSSTSHETGWISA